MIMMIEKLLSLDTLKSGGKKNYTFKIIYIITHHLKLRASCFTWHESFSIAMSESTNLS